MPKMTSLDQSRTYALGFKILPSDSIGFRDKKVSDYMGFCDKKVSDSKKVKTRIPLDFQKDSNRILKIPMRF